MEKNKKILNRNYILYGIVAILLIIFIFLWTLIQSGRIIQFDNNIYQVIEQIRSKELTALMLIITDLGGITGLLLILIISIIILLKKNKKQEVLGIILNLFLSTCIYIILKQIFKRPRPVTGEILIEESGFSFPSGHSTNNMAFYVFAIYLVCINVKNKGLRNALCILLTIIPILVGFSRIYLRVHYPSDVIAGFCLGIVIAILFIQFIYKKIIVKKNRTI